MLACGESKPLLAGEGVWKDRTEVVWSKDTHALIRKTFRVWDPHPELDLVFLWEPRGSVGADPADLVAEGAGTLSWHGKDAADYDRQGTYSVFKGMLRAGRPDGEGSLLVLHTGWSYTGQWRDGLMHGPGVLRLENGDRYEGEFEEGKMQGRGRYSTADGSVYIGEFRDGLRDGAGTLLLAEGGYRTLWRLGQEIAREPLPRSAPLQRPLIQFAANSESVKLRLSLDDEQNSAINVPGSSVESHTYEADYAPGLITVHLGVPQVLEAWKGNGKLIDMSYFGPPSVFMKAEIENAGPRAAQVTGASLVVAESATDPEPYLKISLLENRLCDQISDTYSPNVQLANLGWGQVKDAKLTYSFGVAEKRTDEVTLPLGTFDASSRFSILRRLQKLRVDTERLQKANEEALHTIGSGSTKKPRYGFVCEPPGEGDENDDARSRRLSACFEKVRQSGVLGDLSQFSFQSEGIVYTTLAGHIDYQWIDNDGQAKPRTSPFSLNIPLVSFHIEMGEGGCDDEGGGARGSPGKATMLMVDRRNYQIGLPKAWLTKIDPGQKSQLRLELAAPKSSQHKFQLVLQLANGSQVTSPVIALSYFKPRPAKTR
jgi:hypothetical protein